MSQDLRQKVEEWLKANGYPLEMKCAKVFEDAEFGISLGEYYEDPDFSKKREIDVVANLTKYSESAKIQIGLRFLVECKVARLPWIFFLPSVDSSDPLTPPKSKFDDPAYNLVINLREIDGLSTPGFFLGQRDTAYGGTTALRQKGGGNKASSRAAPDGDESNNQKDLAFYALSAISAAFYNWKSPSLGLFGIAPGVKHVQLRYPLVVVEGRLFTGRLKNQEVEVEERDVVRLKWKGDGSKGGTQIDILTIDSLPTFLSNVVRELDIVMKACENDISLLEQSKLFTKLFSRKEES